LYDIKATDSIGSFFVAQKGRTRHSVMPRCQINPAPYKSSENNKNEFDKGEGMNIKEGAG